MKLFTKLIFAALVLAVLLPFTLLKGKDGKPLMSLDQIKAPDLAVPSLPDGVRIPNLQGGGSANGSSGREDIVYQWRDAEGSLHFTTHPPPQGIEFTVKGYDPNTNLIQSVQPDKPEVVVAPGPASQPAKTEAKVDLGNPYSPESVKKLIDDARNVQNVINERFQQQEALIGNKQD